MADLLTLGDNAALQALSFALAVLGLGLAFRVLRYPDLTADGSFVLGAAVFAATVVAFDNWALAFAAATSVGMAAGALTATLNATFGVNRLLSGILTSMIGYSLAFRFLGGAPIKGLLGEPTMFRGAQAWDQANFTLYNAHLAQLGILALFVAAFAIALFVFLRSQFGLALRATGANAQLVRQLHRSPVVSQFVGLALANGLIAASAALVSAQQGFADVNLAVGIIITLVAALVLGEELLRLVARERMTTAWARVAAPILGAFVYFLLYVTIVRASIRGWIPFSIEPTDLKLISAVLVVIALGLRHARAREEEPLPL
jgi:putative tryptophan/tyrosine transport system permease protein